MFTAAFSPCRAVCGFPMLMLSPYRVVTVQDWFRMTVIVGRFPWKWLHQVLKETHSSDGRLFIGLLSRWLTGAWHSAHVQPETAMPFWIMTKGSGSHQGIRYHTNETSPFETVLYDVRKMAAFAVDCVCDNCELFLCFLLVNWHSVFCNSIISFPFHPLCFLKLAFCFCSDLIWS